MLYFCVDLVGEYCVLLQMSNYAKSAAILFHWMCGHRFHSLTVKIANQNVWNLAKIGIASFSLSFCLRIHHKHFWSSSPAVCRPVQYFLDECLLSQVYFLFADVMCKFGSWSDLTKVSCWLIWICLTILALHLDKKLNKKCIPSCVIVSKFLWVMGTNW